MKKKSISGSVTMFEGAPPKLFGFAQENRNSPTPAEALLWEALKGHQLAGYKFRRQHPVGRFILDFYCHQKKLSVEVDGEYHFTPEQQAYDQRRTAALRELGITELRFLNSQVLHHLAQVLADIQKVLDGL